MSRSEQPPIIGGGSVGLPTPGFQAEEQPYTYVRSLEINIGSPTEPPPDYPARIRRMLFERYKRGEYEVIIQMLKDDPYVMPAADLAFIRADCCERMGKHRLAAIFYADAIRRSPLDADRLLAPSVPLLAMPAEGRVEEAWQIIQIQLELSPNAVTFAVAALLTFHRAQQVKGEARTQLYLEQAQYFDQAREAFDRLPEAVQKSSDVRSVMILGFDTTTFALHLAGDNRRASELAEAGLTFAPEAANLWTIRGIISYPADSAVSAFRRAAEQGDSSYMPYYYLAHDALTKREFEAARHWVQEAIKRGQGQAPKITAQLYEWEAICLVESHGRTEEAEEGFTKAMTADPANDAARRNYELLRTLPVTEGPPSGIAWQVGPPLPFAEMALSDRLGSSCIPRNGSPIERLLAVGVG